MRRQGTLLAACLVGLLLATPFALAQSTSTASTSAGASSSSSISLGSSNVLAALALGAGGRASDLERARLLPLFDDPILGDDACVQPVRISRGGAFAATRADDDMRYRLAHAIAMSGGTPTAADLTEAFAGERDIVVLVDCPGPKPSDVFFTECVARGRGCTTALMIRLLLDADGLDEDERRHALVAAYDLRR